jgi:hypothetical protein
VEVEPVLQIQNIVRNTERMRDIPGVVDRIQRAARPVRHVVAIAEELHGGADNLVALLNQASRCDRAVYPARHRHQNACGRPVAR